MSRIYELSADDVDDFDFPLEASTSTAATNHTGGNWPRGAASQSSMNPLADGLPTNNIPGLSAMLAGMMGTGMPPNQPTRKAADVSKTKKWETIYPRYLDAKVPYKTGARRVALKYSLRWPLAQLIQHACTQIGLPCQLEIDKVHPADWQNPGRVKVQIKRNQKPIDPAIPNKYVLLCKIGTFLRPLESIRLKLPEVTEKDRSSTRTPLPHINLRLPYNSPAISHGFLDMAEAESQKSPPQSDPAIPKDDNPKAIKPSADSKAKSKPAVVSKNKKKTKK
ncbi:hypothetical protein PCASD_03872 [Puccinia coronata f. sp. avenae]|uniref:Signal recognition particle SRP19 subunit n=1 Tax=Puccinia coronata f. sp. avenae TaxID=200324 RepID=A0A2N5V2T0_9BASI|nr:hypothetical protein PCASD_03872 [Puccinia coronata f. sp. avenae]